MELLESIGRSAENVCHGVCTSLVDIALLFEDTGGGEGGAQALYYIMEANLALESPSTPSTEVQESFRKVILLPEFM